MKLKLRVLLTCVVTSILVMACGTAADDMETENVSIEKEETNIVTSSNENTEDVAAQLEEAEPSEEELELLEWQNYLMPNVEDSLNVRIEPSAEAELAGKLERGDRAVVLENNGEWTKIESGKLIGYVKNEYCLYAADALAFAKENCDTVATTISDGLRVREEMNTESKIVKQLEEGDKLVVDVNAATEDGWVAVKSEDSTYYVSGDYVTVSLEIGTGITIEEIEEIRRAEEEAKARAAAEAVKKAAQQTSNEAVAASVDDLTLLASIIYCEAGGECYETQLAVGAVIRNRMISSAYPNTVRDVIYQKGQFGPVNSGKLARVISQGKATASCYQAAQDALNGADNTGGCLFFNDYSSSRSGVIIGNMIFW